MMVAVALLGVGILCFTRPVVALAGLAHVAQDWLEGCSGLAQPPVALALPTLPNYFYQGVAGAPSFRVMNCGGVGACALLVLVVWVHGMGITKAISSSYPSLVPSNLRGNSYNLSCSVA